ncbi:MAG: M56 family metallopeptidase [Bacteroidales bacterium]|nr:M56 family metallopeptidase [Bacteroidales bacterium]
MKQYLLISSVYMALFYIMYLLLISNDTRYRRNRLYLLSGIILSLTLPLIRININAGGMLSAINAGLANVIPIEQVNIYADGSGGEAVHRLPAAALIYLSGCLIAFVILAFNTGRLLKLVRSYRIKGSNIVLTPPGKESGFSALGYVFLSADLDDETRDIIMEHEMNHISKRHFIDIVLLRIMGIVFWFNPFTYLYDRSLKALHEFEADEQMLESGQNVISYQRLILNQIFNTNIFTLQNGFSGRSLIKKRMIMMTKRRSKKRSGLKLLLAAPFILFAFGFFSCSSEEVDPLDNKDKAEALEVIRSSDKSGDKKSPAENTKSGYAEDEIFVVVEDMPTFQGGDVNKFREWVQSNVSYPVIAAENGIQGKVFVMFVVEPDGSVSTAEIMRGVDPSLDNEVISTVESSPPWSPGKQRGENVRVRFSITVNFQLQ